MNMSLVIVVTVTPYIIAIRRKKSIL